MSTRIKLAIAAIVMIFISCHLLKKNRRQCENVLYFKELGLVANYDTSNNLTVDKLRSFRFNDSLCLDVKLVNCGGSAKIICRHFDNTRKLFEVYYKESSVIQYEIIRAHTLDGALIDYSVDYFVPVLERRHLFDDSAEKLFQSNNPK